MGKSHKSEPKAGTDRSPGSAPYDSLRRPAKHQNMTAANDQVNHWRAEAGVCDPCYSMPWLQTSKIGYREIASVRPMTTFGHITLDFAQQCDHD